MFGCLLFKKSKKFNESFHNKWKGIHKITQIELTHAKMMTCYQKQDFYV